MHITLSDIVKIPFFAPFAETPSKLKGLLNFAKLLSYQSEDVVIREGDEDDGALFVVVDGSVIIAKTIDAESGRAKPLATLRKGEFFGEMSLFDSAPRSAHVLAAENSHLLKIDRTAFLELVQTDTELSVSLMSSVIGSVSQRLRRTNMELVVLYDTGRIISRTSRLQDMCAGIIQRLSSSLGSPHGMLYVFNDLSDSYEKCGSNSDLELSESQLRWIQSHLSENQGLRFPEVPPTEEAPEFACRNLLAAPLTIKGRVYGSVVLMRDTSSYNDAEYNLVMGVANQASFAVENARNREEEAAREAYRKRRGRN